MTATGTTFRVLVVDDTPAIHADYRKVLGPAQAPTTAAAAAAVADMESLLFGGGDNGPADAGGPLAAADEPTYDIDSAHQGKEGLEKVKAAVAEGRPYALAFVDMRMPPGWDGVQTIRELWKVDPGLQVAICTAYSDYTPDQIASELRLSGRMLILRKPFDPLEVKQLAAALCDKWQVARHKADLERIVEARTAELKRAALHDALTGLPNRVLFADRLNRALQRSKRDPDYKFAVLFVDTDEFKVVNDSLGHEAGDALLLQIAERLGHSVRGLDTVSRVDGPPGPPKAGAAGGAVAGGDATMAARLGGDEFAMLLDDIRSDADAARVAQRLLDDAARPYDINGHALRSTFSIGITTSALNYDRAEDMLRDADTAMYHAKRQGRARFVMFDQKMHAAAMARLTFENELRAAIDADQIQPYYQPIVEVAGGRVVGFEALARWKHPARGWVPPAEFIPMAEETGMILPLGLRVLEKACRQLAVWQKSSPDLAGLTMSVNVSRRQLVAADLVAQIERVVREAGIRPSTLKLEITESAVINDTRAAVDVLKRIEALDVQLHIDDFGTGYSSLSCLQNFPVTGLKVDAEFVSEATSKPKQAAVLRGIVALARSLNLPLVSEGVETAEQSELLKAMGCEMAQGYLFARPMDAAGATDFIRRNLAVAQAA